MDALQLNPVALALSSAQVLLGILILILAKLALRFLSPYSTDQELVARDNPAFGLALAGYYSGTLLVYLSAAGAYPLPIDQGARAVAIALLSDLGWSLAAIVALCLSRWLFDRTLVHGVRNDIEIVTHKNLACGALEFGSYLAGAVILSGALRQPGGSVWTALVFFLLGQTVIVIMAHAYARFAGYDVVAEIHTGNFAAGLAFALSLVALAIILLKAIAGDWVSWSQSLLFFAFAAVVGFFLLFLLRWVAHAALLPHSDPNAEIVQHRNVNVGLIQGTLAVAVATLIWIVF